MFGIYRLFKNGFVGTIQTQACWLHFCININVFLYDNLTNVLCYRLLKKYEICHGLLLNKFWLWHWRKVYFSSTFRGGTFSYLFCLSSHTISCFVLRSRVLIIRLDLKTDLIESLIALERFLFIPLYCASNSCAGYQKLVQISRSRKRFKIANNPITQK